ncbi:hypothetical protein B296_00001227, partial [Ensete ventricosum]
WFIRPSELKYIGKEPWTNSCKKTLTYWKKSGPRPTSRNWLTKELSQGFTTLEANWHRTGKVPIELSWSSKKGLAPSQS